METVAADGRNLTVPGLDTPDSNPVEPETEFLAFAEGAAFRPEAMAVHSCLTVTASGSWSYHSDKPTGSHIPATGSDWVQSAALSLTATAPHDVRPHLLALMRWETGSAIEPCLAYGRRYLRVWCDRMGQRPRPAMIEAAVVDGLALVFWGRFKRGTDGNPVSVPTVEERRVELNVDKTRFAEYRALMVKVFKRRLSEAATRYKTVSHYRPIRNCDYRENGFAGSSLWIEAHNMPSPVIYYPALPIILDRPQPLNCLASLARRAA